MSLEQKEAIMARMFISYERFSFGTQKAGHSLERQQDAIRQAAKEEGLPIDETLCLRDEGLSAFRGKHWRKGKLGAFLDLVQAGLIPEGSVLCIERVSRLSREPWTDQVRLWQSILEKGIVIRTCVPPTRYTKENMSELSIGCPLAIAMMLSHGESVQKSQMIGDALRRRRAHAIETGKPHGLRAPNWIRAVGSPHPLDPNRRIVERWELIAERVAVIRRVHQLAWDGHGAHTITAMLNEEGIASWTRKAHWTKCAVNHLLRSRALLGEVTPKFSFNKCAAGQKIAYSNYPAVLTPDEYERTQAALASRVKCGGKRGKDRINLFRHLAQDVNGRPLYLVSSPGLKRGKWHYLANDAQTVRVPYALFERAVLGSVRGLAAAQIDGSSRRDAATELAERLQADCTTKQFALDTLNRQLRELPAEKWPASIVVRTGELEEELQRLRVELRTAKEQSSATALCEALSDAQTALAYLDTLDEGETRDSVLRRIAARLGVLVARITVATDGERGRSKWIHIRIDYRGGHADRLSLRIGKPLPPSAEYCGTW